VKGNEVIGDPSQPLGLRGDSIRLWETQHSRVEDNLVRDGRDVVVWYSSDNRIEGNRVERSRYGTHLMYSHRNRIEANHFVGNVTGLFLMYSRDIDVVDNVIAGSAGSAGIGLGLKESGNLRVVANDFVRNTVGIYVDLSPLWPDDHNVFERNVIRLGDAGIVFLGATARNEFRENVLRDNLVSVRVDGGDDALAASWRGNDFDDYVGYDLDGDGTGDVPYELRSLSSELVSRSPALAFLRGTPALGFAEAIGRVVPLFEPKLLLVDPEPRTGPPPEARLAR
jgi:nitrous oxidase accessory protein